MPLLAAIADFLIGDPWHWPHPVQAMGWGIQHYSRWALATILSPWGQRWAGIVLALGLPLFSGGVGAVAVAGIWHWNSAAGIAISSLLFASCLAGRSLRDAAESVLTPLNQGNLVEARQKLRLYVGRDTETLSAPEVLRAVLETVSENATDGVLAPLFYGLVGLAMNPAMGVGLALAYKGLSTLDSMVGYRDAPHTHLGWASARLEDCATWLPCRLTVLTIALLSGRPRWVWSLCQRDAPADPSPNAGWSECAYAAALGVQLGGENYYRGRVKVKPLLGNANRAITALVVVQALGLTRRACLLWLAVGLVGLTLRYGLHCGYFASL